MPTPKLSKAQRDFLRFHDTEPYPHAWEWVEGGGPSKWQTLKAIKRDNKKNKHCKIKKSDLAALNKAGFLNAFQVSPAGREALKANSK